MKIEKASYNALFGSTPVSDIFFTRYLPILDAECVKIYVYILYLASKGENIVPEDLATAIGYDRDTLSAKLIELQQAGLLNLYTDRIIVNNLAADELAKSFRPKTTGDAETAIPGTGRLDEKYRKVSKTISDTFYEGRMPTDLFTDIILWVEKYGFEPETLFLLFQHCKDTLKKTPNRSYILTVADSWGKKGIKTGDQASRYLENYSEFKKYKKSIEKALKLYNGMTVFQEELVQKWYFTFRYSIEIINIALAKSVKASSASLAYYDTIISDWFSKGLHTAEEIEEYEKNYKEKNPETLPVKKPLPQSGNSRTSKSANYNERKYDEDFFNSFLGGNK